jgi:predicted nucleic acid-binding protein
MTAKAWRRAGLLSAELDSLGTRIPPSDVILGALALEGGHEVFTPDNHFRRIPGLRLYQPEGGAP